MKQTKATTAGKILMRIAIALTETPAGMERLAEIAPEAVVRVMPHGTGLEGHLDWAEIVFGNMTGGRI